MHNQMHNVVIECTFAVYFKKNLLKHNLQKILQTASAVQ
jgi:hypothetical protein